MKYRVELTERFIADFDDHLLYLQREKVSAFSSNRWFARLYEKVLSLDDIPKRYPVDRVFTESSGVVIRKMNLVITWFSIRLMTKRGKSMCWRCGTGRHGKNGDAQSSGMHLQLVCSGMSALAQDLLNSARAVLASWVLP